MSSHPYASGRVAAENPESGRIGLLFTALVGVVLALCLLAANISAIHLQHRRGLACADSLALAGASELQASSYYCAQCGSRTQIEAVRATNAVQSKLGELASTSCLIGQNVEVTEVNVTSADVSVVVTFQSELVFLPPILGELVAPEIQVNGKSRLLNPQ